MAVKVHNLTKLDYPVQNLRERLNFIAKNDPRHASIQATSRYFVPIEKY